MTARGWVAEQGSVALQIRRPWRPGLAEVVMLQSICVAFVQKQKEKKKKKHPRLFSHIYFTRNTGWKVKQEKVGHRKQAI